MNMVTIYIITVVILVIAIIIKLIPWRDWAVSWVGDNPARAQIYIKAGSLVYTIEGKRVLMHPAAQAYQYESDDGKLLVWVPGPGMPERAALDHNGKEIIDSDTKQPVKLPEINQVEYPYVYIRGRRMIFIEDGQLVASAPWYMSEADKRKYSESVTEVSEAFNSGVYVSAIRSVKRPGAFSWKWIVVVLIIAAAAYYFYTQNSQPAGSPVNPGTIPQQTQPQIPPTVPPDTKPL